MTLLSDTDILAAADELREEGVHQSAVDVYAWLLDHDDSADAHFGIGQSYGKLGRYDAAIAHLDVAFARKPDRQTGQGYYAYILERAGRMAEAGDRYDRALRGAERDDLWTRSHHAWFLEKDGRLDAAEQAFAAILAEHPTHTWSSKRYASLLWRRGRPEEAAKVLHDSINSAPGNLYPKLNYLEHLLLTSDEDYRSHRAELDQTEPDWLPVLLELFDYYRDNLLSGRSDPERLARWAADADRLTAGVHRDFDDLTALLASRHGDVGTWRRQLDRLRR